MHVFSLKYVVRFPDPLVEVGRENECPESGEFFFHGRLRQKFSLKVDNSAQNWPSQHVNSHFLIDQPRASSLGAAVELLFFLPPVWAFSHNSIFQSDFRLDFLHIFQTFVSHLFSSLPLIWANLSIPLCLPVYHILMWRTGGPLLALQSSAHRIAPHGDPIQSQPNPSHPIHL